MSDAPHYSVNLAAFTADPYPDLAAMRRDAPIAYVPELDATLLTRHAHIAQCEKNTEVFSSWQPEGLMTRLMGENLMRKDGRAHMAERRAIYPAMSPKTVTQVWQAQFHRDALGRLAALENRTTADLFWDYAMPVSADALRALTGLVNMSAERMNAVSQAMIDGCANYHGDPEVEARCHAATAEIDACIDERVQQGWQDDLSSLLAVQYAAGMSDEQICANIKLSISGGQNEPRDAIAGAVWALLSHPEQLQQVLAGQVSWLEVFEEYARWISPIGMSPRRVAQAFTYEGVRFEPEDRVFLMFSSGNRDEAMFPEPDRFDTSRKLDKSLSFGAGPHYCAGAWASRALIAQVALPLLFQAMPDLKLEAPVTFSGWAFRGPLSLPCSW